MITSLQTMKIVDVFSGRTVKSCKIFEHDRLMKRAGYSKKFDILLAKIWLAVFEILELKVT